jgi:FkbM family methyltransferase
MRKLSLNERLVIMSGRDGYFLVNVNDVYVGRALFIYGEYNGLERDFLIGLVAPGNVVVEVGANIGSHTVALAKAAGPAGKVHAFEPQRACYSLLETQSALNGLENIHAHRCGVGRAKGRLSMPRMNYGDIGNFGALELTPNKTPRSEDIDVVTLDDMLADSACALIKIDVEGMEEDVIRGAVGVINKTSPLLYVENDRLEKSKTLIETLLGLKYRLWWHMPPLFNPNNFFGIKDNVYDNIVSCNMFCCRADHGAAKGLKEIKSADDPHPVVRPVPTHFT